MSDIAIFVSHRIDLPCETPNNPLYHPMRCGAVYDTSGSKIPGDNTGDNISDRRNSFCELTVQYWAWKNYQAEYYGLCHYRRYFSFSDQVFAQNTIQIKEYDSITNSANKYSLLDQDKMERIIHEYDAVIPHSVDVRTVLTGVSGSLFYPRNVFEFWRAKKAQIDTACLDYLIETVKKNAPKYYPSLMEYLNGTDFYGGNCYIMKRSLFEELCNFQFPILFQLEKKFDIASRTGEMARQPGFMGEILYAAFLIYLKNNGYKLKKLQVVFFAKYRNAEHDKAIKLSPADKNVPLSPLKSKLKAVLKTGVRHISPAYRTSLRIEEKINDLLGCNNPPSSNKSKKPSASALAKQRWDAQTLTANINLNIACFALELQDTHKASFSEFRNCHTGKSVVIVATGPSMKYYTQIPGMPHIGVNAAFKNENIKLDYYFTTDFESRNDWFFELKNYDFIKFFGQYSAGVYRDRFQVSEQIIFENQGRRFFQGAPNEDIHLDISRYPLMGFYSISFQAIHFAIFTNPKRIFLVGCDCSSEGYFDGSTQLFANLPKWVKGYQKLKEFAERFYPETEIISINPVGLKGLFRDVYTENYLDDHPEIDRASCEILDLALNEEESK